MPPANVVSCTSLAVSLLARMSLVACTEMLEKSNSGVTRKVRIDRAFVIRRTPVGVVHHERARAAELLVPYPIRRADGAAGIARRGLDVDIAEGRAIEDQSVGHAVVAAA